MAAIHFILFIYFLFFQSKILCQPIFGTIYTYTPRTESYPSSLLLRRNVYNIHNASKKEIDLKKKNLYLRDSLNKKAKKVFDRHLHVEHFFNAAVSGWGQFIVT